MSDHRICLVDCIIICFAYANICFDSKKGSFMFYYFDIFCNIWTDDSKALFEHTHNLAKEIAITVRIQMLNITWFWKELGIKYGLIYACGTSLHICIDISNH